MAKISIIATAAFAATASARGLRGLAAEPAAAVPTAAEPNAVGTNGSGMPPAYLSVPNFESCLTKETVGSSEQWCIPAAKPSACIDSSWGEISKENMSLTACAATDGKSAAASDDKAATKDAPATADAPAMDEYKQKIEAFMTDHKAQIDAFVSKHKDAIDEAKADIAEAIKNKDFDFENYQAQLKSIVDKHSLDAYKAQFEKYVEGHKAEIQQFVSKNKDVLKDVEDKIKESVESGQFDFTNYQEQLQAFINQYDLQKYQKQMDTFVSEHKAEIEDFVAANKQAVEDVQQDIADLVNTGNFDYKNFEETIQNLVTKYDQGLSKYSPTDEQKQQISDAIDTAKNSKAGKTLAGYAQKASSAEQEAAKA